MKVFVTGGTGFVGSYVLQSLRNAGHDVRVLVRKGSERKLPFTDGLSIVHGDQGGDAGWESALEGVDAVIHLVGIIREFPSRGITFQKLHTEATRQIVDAAVRMGVKKIAHMSANGASQTGVSAYQRTKWEGERAVTASGLEWTIFRPSVIFGDPVGRMEFASELAKVVRIAPVFPVFGGGMFKLSPVAVENVAECFVKALAEPSAKNRVFHLGGMDMFTFRDIVKIVGAAIGRRNMPTMGVPFAIIRPVAGLLGGFEFFPVTVDQLDMLRQGNVCPENEWIKVFSITPKRFDAEGLRYLSKEAFA
ncbi:MAG: complex I NDUFA9 subunit family protein [Nitrospinae bacterium]|nr:complex I NDUFA9 subunit family protein [Nitrospinota bacterium]